MADLSDVLAALTTLSAQAVYPNGTGSPSVTGGAIRVYSGWPLPTNLDNDLRAISQSISAGACHVSIFARPEEKNVTRFSRDWLLQTVQAATLTATIVGQTVVIGGTIPTASNPQFVTLNVNSAIYVYAVQVSDTLITIATALAALTGASNSGATITFSNAARLNAARVGGTGTSIREIRRQEKTFQIVVWADSPIHRDQIAQPIDILLSNTQFINFADGSSGRLVYKSTMISDEQQNDRIYRRDLFYSVEYPTIQSATDTVIGSTQLNNQLANGSVNIGPSNTTYQ